MKIPFPGLYKVKEYCWLLFPNKEMANKAKILGSLGAGIRFEAIHRSQQLSCQIGLISKKKLIHVIEVDGEFARIVGVEGTGWIYVPERIRPKNCFKKVS